MEKRHRERQAGIWLDPVARDLFSAMARETSIRWEDLPEKTHSDDWSKLCKATALLAGANLCEAGPTRFRLNGRGVALIESLTKERWKELVERGDKWNPSQLPRSI